MKQITINDTEYDIDCNAYTYIQYRQVFNRGFFQDIQILKDYLSLQAIETLKLKSENPEISEIEISAKVSDKLNNKLDEFIEAITRIAYILIYTANDKIDDYKTFLTKIRKFKIDDDWIVEVTELAVDCFC